ncbi:hypothetical protein [Alicyclobacillus fastidiosus]|uniref:hypothetical protein n=1 Tax=Alicyclobacillus fastidiosus TaxID=392011 RepID=UPI0023E9D565|nr:hypothetical protein GCM10025859_12100 [Alicyclobacillus fastidiosus]
MVHGRSPSSSSEKGYRFADPAEKDIRLVFNFVEASSPRPFRRKAQATYVISVVETNEQPQDVLRAAYPTLIRALSNLLIYIVNTGDHMDTYFVTLEQGYYKVPYEMGQDDKYFEYIFKRMEPLTSSNLIINNEFEPDLPEDLWEGDDITEKVRLAAKKSTKWICSPQHFRYRKFFHQKIFGMSSDFTGSVG